MSLDVYLEKEVTKNETVFEYNITHNLTKMASESGIYYQLWRPEEIGVSVAGDLIKPLEQGLYLLENNKKRFEEFNPENGWGDYDGFVEFVREYLRACREHSDSKIIVSR